MSNGDSDVVQFVLDGEPVSLSGIDPSRTVLQYLREDLGRTGTKEGCAEGDCGACTVVLGQRDPNSGAVQLRAVNSCIQFVPSLHGKALITVESLGGDGDGLHPVQQAMVECHGSQCGFCTPGFVMSLFALYCNQKDPQRRDIDDTLSGNLCRCTGYVPIVTAARRMAQLSGKGARPNRAHVSAALDTLTCSQPVSLAAHGCRYYAPTRLPALAGFLMDNPDALIVAGGTDVGLWVTKALRRFDTIVSVSAVRELTTLTIDEQSLDIGAAVTLTDACPALIAEYPELEEMFLRFASPPIRNAATLGGNVANGSPIGDSMPALIALGASVVLMRGDTRRELPLEDFYQDYQKTALTKGEFVERIRVPRRRDGQHVQCYKVSKRFDQDISAVCGAWSLTLDGHRVESIRVAYGGIAAVPKRALQCEAVLQGHEWNEAGVRAGMQALDTSFSPIDDMRANAAYRRTVTRNLLYRFYLETTGAAGENVYDVGR